MLQLNPNYKVIKMDNDVIQCADLKFKRLYTKQQIANQVDLMAEQIDQDFQEILKNDPNARFLVIGILNGAFMITSEIVRRLKTPVQIDFIKISSYKGTQSGQLTIQSKIQKSNYLNTHLLILDDICDSGKTLLQLTKIFSKMEAKTVKVGVLVIRPDKKKQINPDYFGLTCSQFIVGFGLDYAQQGRQYPEIYQKYDENE